MLNINDYRELFVEEHEKKYLIKCIDNHNKVVWFEFGKDDKRKVIDLIYSFLNVFKINGVNNSSSIFNDYNTVDILLSNGSKKIILKTHTPEFKVINKFILEKYTANRDEFFKTADINNIVINAAANGRGFSLIDDVVNLTLNADFNMNISVSEREFIRNFLQIRCDGRKINVEFIKDKNGMNETCVAICGEFKMVFPTGYTYSTILRMITDHNDKIVESRKRR